MSREAILTLNAGSSTIKVGLFDAGSDAALATGLIDRIGGAGGLRLTDAAGLEMPLPPLPEAAFRDHASALQAALAVLNAAFPGVRIAAVGHRVVHGGAEFTAPVVLTDAVLARLAALSPFAPLHQPHNLAAVRAATAAFPQALQLACFDTAFHRNQPFVNDTFALPRRFYDKGIRRYGFHGLSYEFIAGELARIAPSLHVGRVVVAHLGNGASMCGLLGGRSVASTMGFSALDGLPMGTRCGQLDPGVVLYLMAQEGMDAAAIADLLYLQSGLLGLSELSHDMRTLEAADTPGARAAIDYFTFRIRRELGGLAAALGGLDALVFCGGIGENSRLIRQRVCEGMGWIGIELDPGRNADNAALISTGMSRVQVLVIPTNEELVIARAARRLICKTEGSL
ncbi:MAG TPA: acetate/propionate family kinase [Paracoccaceae bacterium]